MARPTPPPSITALTSSMTAASMWPVPIDRAKSQADLLLEAAVFRQYRPEAVKALVWLGSPRARALETYHSVITTCADTILPGVLRPFPPSSVQCPHSSGEAFLVPSSTVRTFDLPNPSELEWQKRLHLSMSIQGPQQLPVTSEHAIPDRNPLDGIVDQPSVAVWNDDTDIVAETLRRHGFHVLWSHSPSQAFNPYTLPPVDVLLAYPDCAPFHASSTGLQHDAVADTCTALLVLSSLRPLVAVFEFSAAMWTMQDEVVKDFVLACAGLLKYRWAVTFYDHSSFSPFAKPIVSISFTRLDVADSWGILHVPVPAVSPQRWPLSLPPNLPAHLFIDQQRVQFTWILDPDSIPADHKCERPIQVAWAKSNTCGNRVYILMSPAVKASTFGVGGNTHLIAQRDATGKWHVRKLFLPEITASLVPSDMGISLPHSPLKAIAALATATPFCAAASAASAILSFLRPALPRLPRQVSELISPQHVQVFRANLNRMHEDLVKMTDAG